MNIHEYQGKELLKKYNINVPNGILVENIGQLSSKLRRIESDIVVVKAQIHAGGRGKAGGVKVTTTLSEALEAGNNMLGKKLITHQTGPKGQLVRKIYLEEGCQIKKEFYLSLVLDRESSSINIVSSNQGGMDIEEVSQNSPHSIVKVSIDPFVGINDFHARYLANKLNLTDNLQSTFFALIKNLYKCFLDKDMNMIEINPLVLNTSDEWIALDAKMSFDENALYRHDDILALKDIFEEDSKEAEARKYGLSYVSLDGDIACLVNGAGLAMATMDSINQSGGSPANFLDVGGSATVEMVTKAIEIILSDAKVKGLFINIFGGIMQCDTITLGIIEAMNKTNKDIPLVVRLEGNNVELGINHLKKSKLNIVTADSMDEGADIIVSLVKKEDFLHEYLG